MTPIVAQTFKTCLMTFPLRLKVRVALLLVVTSFLVFGPWLRQGLQWCAG
jgi:hypothetical protein